MSTRGLIAIEDADRKCRSIYVHFDMYINGAGETLIKYYKTIKRIEKLLSLGDISSLGGRLSNTDNKSDAKKICMAYHRDYGEELNPPQIWNNAEEMLDKAKDRYGAEYLYLFRKGKWYINDTYRREGWRSVEDELRELRNG